jgi:hypothetical protein
VPALFGLKRAAVACWCRRRPNWLTFLFVPLFSIHPRASREIEI